jgi:mRNA interferase MazF
MKLADAPGNVLLPRKLSGLSHDSVANVSQVYTIDKSFLTEKVCALPVVLLTRIDAGLRLALSL